MEVAKLKMYENSPIPEKCLASNIAILGKTGSGKTYTAKGMAEGLLSNGARVCVLDPTGSWWGLRSTENGNKAAFPIVVFGGEHADIPLGENHGATIGEIIATTETSAILDTRLMGVGERTRFFTHFAETLLRKNKGPLHLIVDEAHLFAPQGRVNDPQSGKMLHAANNLVSLGRSAGLRITLISQRPAKLHKDSLTQVETLIAMRLIAPQDVGAVKDWIGEWADPKEGKELLQSLPSQKTGTGWIWAPEIGVLKQVAFPKISTYDSSKAPDEDQSKVVLASIDMESIQKRLESVTKDFVENDPKRLKAKIIELERNRNIDPELINKARNEGFEQGRSTGFKEGLQAAQKALVEIGQPEAKATSAPLRAAPIAVMKPRPTIVPKMANGNDPLLAAALSVWPVKMTWGGLATMCGWKARGGAFNTRRKRLLEGQLLREEGNVVVPVNPPDIPQNVIPADVLEEKLPAVSSEMFKTIRNNPGISVELLAQNLGKKPHGGSWNTGMSTLRRNGLIEERGGGLYIEDSLL